MDPTKKRGNNQKNNHNKTQHKPRLKPKVLIQPGYATGDMFAIAAALMDDDELEVVISKGDKNCNDPTDKADSIKKFYEDSGIAESRIHVVKVKQLRKDKESRDKLDEEARKIQPTGKIEGVNYGTYYVAKYFSKSMQKKIRDGWKINDNNGEDDAIKKWLAEKGIPTSGNRLLILWSRFSGKNGDIHIEHDTSYFGIKQIANRVVDMYDAIIITGDKAYQEERRDKGWRIKDSSKKRGYQFDEIADEINSKINASKVFNITEFWNDKDSNDLSNWGGNTRLGQFKLYEYFQKNFEEVKHLGFRSGNLEVMAMLGYSVRYMEEKANERGDESDGAFRMTAWNTRRKNLMDKNIPQDERLNIGYERISLIELPTRTGKDFQKKRLAIDNDNNDEREKLKRPDFTPGKKYGTQKPDYIRNTYLRGFSNTDLDTLVNQYLHVGWEGAVRKESEIEREKKYYVEKRPTEDAEILNQEGREKRSELIATQPS